MQVLVNAYLFLSPSRNLWT